MAAPGLTHAFDLTINGPPGFASEGSSFSNLSAAYGQFPRHETRRRKPVADTLRLVYEGSLKSADGTIEIPLLGGTDWMRLHETYADIDARVSCATKPGAAGPQLNCDVSYRGKITFHGPMKALWAGEKSSLDWHEGYYYTSPVLESRSEQLAWVNETVFLGMGKITLTEAGNLQVVYRIFKVHAN